MKTIGLVFYFFGTLLLVLYWGAVEFPYASFFAVMLILGGWFIRVHAATQEKLRMLYKVQVWDRASGGWQDNTTFPPALIRQAKADAEEIKAKYDGPVRVRIIPS